MTPQQEHLIRQAIGALRAALGTAPELPFAAACVEPANLYGMKHKTRELAAKLYALHGTKSIDWHDMNLRRFMFDAGYNYADNFIVSLERRGIIEVDRTGPANKRISSFRFIKAVSA